MKQKNKGQCFNKKRIGNLKDAWEQYNMGWDDNKNDIPVELYKIIEEIIWRLEDKDE